MKTIVFFILFFSPLIIKAENEIIKSSQAIPSVQKEYTDEEVINHFKLWDEKLNSLQTNFKQEIFFKEADIKQEVNGEVFYKKPNFLKIKHLKPTQQTIITDKKEIYIYKDNQIYKMSWKYWEKNQEKNISGILNFGNYSKIFDNNNFKIKNNKENIEITFKNKEESNSSTLTLYLSKENYFPYKAVLNMKDSEIKTYLNNININPNMDNIDFSFKKKKNNEIIEIGEK